MNGRLITVALAMFAAMLFVSSAQAQRHAGFTFAPATRTGTLVPRGHGVGTGFAHLRRMRRFFGGGAFGPYFFPDYYSDYESEPGMIEPPPPQVVMAPPPELALPAQAAKPPESLLLELHGDHWVRITNYGLSQSGAELSAPAPGEPSKAAAPASKLPPAVLVFRDGHTEEVGKYTIIGPTIYTRADYWTSGSWTRKVQIAELDVPATLTVNQERGAKFRLPSGPNEVIIRP